MESPTATLGVSRTVGKGVLAGIVAGITMAMFAMIAAATYQDTGFFTPMYHIVSTFIDPTAMETSMKEAMGGNLYYFSAGPAALGIAIHIMTAIAFGVIFALLVTWLGLRGPVAPLVGYPTFRIEHAIYGLVLGSVLAPRREHAGVPRATTASPRRFREQASSR
jgi:hypothetical protein